MHETQVAWNKLADDWIEDKEGTRLHCREGLLDTIILKNFENIEGQHILDLGCGAGRFARMLASRGAQVTGVDLCEKLLHRANQHPEKNDLQQFILEDAHQLSSQQDQSFDAAISYISLIDFSDITRIAHTLHRVLKPGAKAVICNVHPYILGSKAVVDDSVVESQLDLSTYFDESQKQFNVYGHPLPAYHRTFSKTINTFLQADFRLLDLQEPQASEEAVRKYPALGLCHQLPVFVIMTFERM